jgi:lipopolysaccharide export system ATP-binding protein
LNDFRITHIRDSFGYALSGGERRRVEIARSLAGSPKFLLLDEPFAGIDPIAVGDIQDIIRLLKSKGMGVLITDHNVRETLGICDFAYILKEGQIQVQGTADEIANNELAKKFYLGENFKL